MKENLDKWIKDAKEVAPDSGEYRRLNRILVKEHMATTRTGRGRTHRILVVSVALVFLMMTSGQISQLGSDGFNTIKSRELSSRGDTMTVYSNEFRGGRTSLPENFTEADVDEFQRSVAAGDGTVLKATGLSYGGKTSWLKHTARTINDKVIMVGSNPDSPPSQEPDNLMAFLETYHRDLIASCKAEPPHDTRQMRVDGILMEFGVWRYEYPGFGEVTRYVGYPIENK